MDMMSVAIAVGIVGWMVGASYYVDIYLPEKREAKKRRKTQLKRRLDV